MAFLPDEFLRHGGDSFGASALVAFGAGQDRPLFPLVLEGPALWREAVVQMVERRHPARVGAVEYAVAPHEVLRVVDPSATPEAVGVLLEQPVAPSGVTIRHAPRIPEAAALVKGC